MGGGRAVRSQMSRGSRSTCEEWANNGGSLASLTPLPGTVVALNPTGSSNIDIAVSADGKFLYSLNAGSRAVGMFAINAGNGTLTDLGTIGGLLAAAGLNGIAAN